MDGIGNIIIAVLINISMNTSNKDNIFTVIIASLIFLTVIFDHGLWNPLFIVLAIGAVVVLRVLLAIVHRNPDLSERRLDHELQMDLLDHKLANPTFDVVTREASSKVATQEVECSG